MGVSVTVCIPIGPKHVDLASRAIQSAERQTLTVNVLWLVDEQQRGPGALRNEMLAQVLTPFVIFLDADDWIEPDFVAKTLAVFERTDKYVYTDWLEDGYLKQAPAQAWCGDTWHVVTALIPTAWVREIGGFDERLPAMEDSDFYLRLTTARHCGVRLPEPLFNYSNDGTRSDEFRENDAMFKQLKGEVTRRYANMYGCCGSSVDDQPPVGARLEGDVIAQALWHGNRTMPGRASTPQRIYERTSWPHLLWVDPRDVQAMPSMFRLMETPVNEAVPMNGLDALDKALNFNAPVATPVYTAAKIEPIAATPNVANVLRLGKRK